MADILVVDEEHRSRELVSEILRDFGYRVVAAPSIADVARLCASTAMIDLALLDTVTLERGGGPLSLQSFRHGGRTPVIAMTRASTGQAWAPPLPGVVAYLEKPVGLRLLLRTVQRALASRLTTSARTKGEASGGTARKTAPRNEFRLEWFELPLREARKAFERHYLEHHLRAALGNVARVSARVGVERTHLHRKLNQLGILGAVDASELAADPQDGA